MSANRIIGILIQEYYITKRSLEVIMDLFFFTAMAFLAFGLVASFLFTTGNQTAGSFLLIGIIFWEVIRVNQYSMSVGSLWNIWSRNLSNMFISPISINEYLFAHMLSGLLKSFLIFSMLVILAILLYGFNVFDLGISNVVASFINLIIFSWSVGILILGIIFRYGTRIQAFAWGLIFLFQPLTAAFFPLEILPQFVQYVALLLPPTFVFEALRGNVTDPTFNLSYQSIALAENIFYFVFSIWLFNILFNHSKKTGQFANNEN